MTTNTERLAQALERMFDNRAHWRMAIRMMCDFTDLLKGRDHDADCTDWQQVLIEFESTLDALAALSQHAAEQADVPDYSTWPDEEPKCRDCADFGPICPNSGKPCGGAA